MFTKMFCVSGVFLDVYEDVLGCLGVPRCLRSCSGLLESFNVSFFHQVSGASDH